MAAVAVALSSPAGRPCTSPSTITPASPSPACCPTRPLTPPSPSYVPHSPSMPSTAFPFAACSPITDLAIAPIAFAPPARNWAYVIASHALTRHAPTVRPNASSKLLFASGLTSATTPTPKNAISSFPPGCTTTTSPVPMVASVTLHLSAELLRKVQPLEGSQLAHRSKTGDDPDSWAQCQLWPAVLGTVEWMRDWYVLACDGENRWVRHVASLPFVPGGTGSAQIPNTVDPFPPPTCWRAPAWLFQISPLLGVGPLKTKHVPSMDSVEKLGEAHTRLLLSGARRSLLWELGAVIVKVRNEEIAAGGAVPAETVGRQEEGSNNAEHWLKGIDGLGRKTHDFSRYMRNLTDKQQLAFSLR